MAFPIDITRESNSPEHLQFQVGQRVFNKRYELIEMIGSGGMGFIWRAFDQVGQKDVALKFLPTILVHHPKEMDRLRKEVDAGQKLRHDLIVATHGLEVEGALAAIVMEFVQGETLKQKLEGCERGFFEPAEIEPWFNDIVSALGYLHGDKALLHRDIKPANIIVDEKGRARLLDFGISQTLQETMGRHTQTGAAQSTSNTLAYASPESLELGHKPAITDDIYSLGATVYELLTGTPPFYQGTPAIIALHIVKTPVPSVMQRRAELVEGGMNKTVGQPLDARWQALVSACLAKEPAQRPQSVKALDWRTAKVVESFSSRDEASGDAVREGPLPSSVPPMRSAPAPQKAPPPAERHGLKPEITFAARFTKRVAILSVGVLAAYAFWPQSTTPRTDEPAKEVLVVKEVPKEIIKEVPVKDPDTERKLAEMQNANEELRKKLAEVPKPAPTPPPQPKPPRAEIVQEPSLIERLTTQGNSLGMKFVTFASLNGGKLSVLGCEHETRSKDFAIFFADPQRVSFYKDTVHAEVSDAGQWRTFVYRDSPVGRSMAERAEDSEHCVVKVSWLDAQAFCAWLTERERWAGLIGPQDFYRLPTDFEWSLMAGIANQEDNNATPKQRDEGWGNAVVYPWEGNYPPEGMSGNYADESAWSLGLSIIEGYRDGFATTAPVKQFPPNKLGFYDMGGNVWEWCDDWIDGTSGKKRSRTLRGASWFIGDKLHLASSDRDDYGPQSRDCNVGFRCVVVVGSSQ